MSNTMLTFLALSHARNIDSNYNASGASFAQIMKFVQQVRWIEIIKMVDETQKSILLLLSFETIIDMCPWALF